MLEYLCPPRTRKIIQQPKPLPLKRPHASFLQDSVDQLPSSPAPKRYRPESIITQWIESISESYQERHCRSDTLLGHSDGELTPRRLTKSPPNMEYTQGADGFVMPSAPASWSASSAVLSNKSGASTGLNRKTLVEDPSYRENNLAENNIYIRDFYDEFPEDIARLVDHVRKDRDSPGLSSDFLRQNTRLHDLEMRGVEPAVGNYFKANIFPDPGPSDSLKHVDTYPMAKQVVPDVGSKLKVSTPVPDMLYGYNRLRAFTHGQQAQFRSMGNEMVVNSQGLVYPFFVIEFKGDGPGGSGSLWEGTNQCLGGSASCVNVAERLNHRLRQCKNSEVQPIDSAAFSITMNGTEARLYISWKHNELDYYMRKVKSFLLQDPDHYLEFRKYVQNIIDWGKDKRLKEIQKSLDSLLEENRKTASQLAKSRPQPLDDCASSSHKHLGRGCNSRTEGVQEHPSSGANDPPSVNFQGNNQDESFVQTRAADSVYAPPSASFQEHNQDDPIMQISTAKNRYISPYALITPPQSAEDTSLPIEPSEDSCVRGHRRTR